MFGWAHSPGRLAGGHHQGTRQLKENLLAMRSLWIYVTHSKRMPKTCTESKHFETVHVNYFKTVHAKQSLKRPSLSHIDFSKEQFLTFGKQYQLETARNIKRPFSQSHVAQGRGMFWFNCQALNLHQLCKFHGLFNLWRLHFLWHLQIERAGGSRPHMPEPFQYMCHGRKHPGNVSRTLLSFRIVVTRSSCWLARGFEWKWHSFDTIYKFKSICHSRRPLMNLMTWSGLCMKRLRFVV